MLIFYNDEGYSSTGMDKPDALLMPRKPFFINAVQGAELGRVGAEPGEKCVLYVIIPSKPTRSYIHTL